MAQQEQATRYPMNPEKYWGPKARAHGKRRGPARADSVSGLTQALDTASQNTPAAAEKCKPGASNAGKGKGDAGAACANVAQSQNKMRVQPPKAP